MICFFRARRRCGGGGGGGGGGDRFREKGDMNGANSKLGKQSTCSDNRERHKLDQIGEKHLWPTFPRYCLL